MTHRLQMEGPSRSNSKNSGLKIVDVREYSSQPVDDDQKIYISNNKNRKLYQFVEQNKQVNLMNVTIVEWDQERQTYKQIMNPEQLHSLHQDSEVTCMVPSSDDTEAEQSQYVMMNEQEGPVVYVQSTMGSSLRDVSDTTIETETAQNDMELLEQAQAKEKIKALLVEEHAIKRGRKRKYPLPLPNDLNHLSDLRLYLYSCNMCQYRCNAIKDLTVHKEAAHGKSRKKRRSSTSKSQGKLKITYHQCPKCTFKGVSNDEFLSHYEKNHVCEDDSSND